MGSKYECKVEEASYRIELRYLLGHRSNKLRFEDPVMNTIHVVAVSIICSHCN